MIHKIVHQLNKIKLWIQIYYNRLNRDNKKLIKINLINLVVIILLKVKISVDGLKVILIKT